MQLAQVWELLPSDVKVLRSGALVSFSQQQQRTLNIGGAFLLALSHRTHVCNANTTVMGHMFHMHGEFDPADEYNLSIAQVSLHSLLTHSKGPCCLSLVILACRWTDHLQALWSLKCKTCFCEHA